MKNPTLKEIYKKVVARENFSFSYEKTNLNLNTDLKPDSFDSDDVHFDQKKEEVFTILFLNETSENQNLGLGDKLIMLVKLFDGKIKWEAKSLDYFVEITFKAK